MEQSEIILQISQDILAYGPGMDVKYEKNGFTNVLVPSITRISEIVNGSNLYNYILKIVETLHPDKLIFTVKKPNGTSWTNPKTFELDLKQIEVPNPIAPEPPQMNMYKAQSMNLGTPEIQHNNSNPMIQVYQFQLQNVKEELAKEKRRADKFEDLFDKIKDQKYEIQKQLDTVEERHKLEKLQDKLASENTAAGMIRELKPELQGLMGIMVEKMGGKTQAIAGPNDQPKETKLVFANQVLTEIDDATFSLYWEVLMRLGHAPADQKDEVLHILRNSTQPFTPTLAQFDKYPNK
jgi:hypothetical protein